MADNTSTAKGRSVRDYSIVRGDLPPEVIHQDITFPWMVSERALKALKDYDVREDDLWVTAYPKSGILLLSNW